MKENKINKPPIILKKNNKFIFPLKKKFYMFDDKKGEAFFEVSFKSGTFSPKIKDLEICQPIGMFNDIKRTS